MKAFKRTQNIKSISVIGNYLPRTCGIATFTKDLCDAIEAELGQSDRVSVVAMDNIDGGYNYPPLVKFQLRDNMVSEYIGASDFLNVNQYDLAILQHEYGIFGGPDGSHILTLVKNLTMPLITTLHTILEKPSDEQKKILKEIGKYSDAVVSMSRKGAQMLETVYNIPKEKIRTIHHGIPDIGFEDPCFYKKTFGLEERKVILSFGLIHPGKGLEYAIKAMPEIVKKHPEVIYIILGATHPNILRDSGDAYRQSLLQLVNKLGLEQHVQFKNKFVDLEGLCHYLGASDIYMTPYVNEEQIVSGTLAYAVGAGKAVVSTPYWYAEEILSGGRGVLVDFCNSTAIAKSVIDLLDDEKKRDALRRKAFQFGRSMIWKEVAREYILAGIDILENSAKKPKTIYIKSPVPGAIDAPPVPKLNHLKILTDSVGILQHANYSVPDRDHGYCIDDNARALIVTSKYFAMFKDESILPLTQTYLAFLYHAFNQNNGRFRNFMSYDRKWLEEEGSEDSHGRTIWGLGIAVKHAQSESIRHMAARLFIKGLPATEDFIHGRSFAFSIVGIHAYLEVYGGDAYVRKLRKTLSNRLLERFKDPLSETWPWFEDKVTYANAKLPHALILAGQWIPDEKMFLAGLHILKWLLKIQTAEEGHLSIVGNSRWMTKEGVRSSFDQQPLEAAGIVEACMEAYRSTGDKFWSKEANKGVNWFLGRNDLNTPLYDFKSGGCFDGLESNGVNQNQGAESTLAGLLSLLTIQEIFGHDILCIGKSKLQGV